MSTTASLVNPSSVNNDNSKYVIAHPVTTGSNPSLTAVQAGAARNEYQHGLVQVSKGKIGGGGSGKKNKNKNKNKKSKKYSRKSAMKKRFSKKFRRSVLRRKSRKMLHKKNKKASLHGGAGATASGDKLTIPSFRQTSPTGTGIINQLAGNHAQTLAYSAYDGEVKPVS
jgi:hypothetical protein